jgi:DNA repair protein RadC
MKALAPQDRPREKLARAGVASLGDNELLAVVLGVGMKGRDALTLAQDVLSLAGGITGLAALEVGDLLGVAGVGTPRAARLVAAVELGRRSVTQSREPRLQLRRPDDIGRYLLPLYGGHREERFGIVMLDAKMRLIRSQIVSVGTLDASIAHPRDIFRAAILASAFSIVAFHNHPSGDPTPSADDVRLTSNLAAAGRVMDIEVVDHIILGAGRWYSFRQAGFFQ